VVVSCILSANSPEAATVPINIDNVEFAKVIFKAIDEDVVVNSIKLVVEV
jgi:hypothetical protein